METEDADAVPKLDKCTKLTHWAWNMVNYL